MKNNLQLTTDIVITMIEKDRIFVPSSQPDYVAAVANTLETIYNKLEELEENNFTIQSCDDVSENVVV